MMVYTFLFRFDIFLLVAVHMKFTVISASQ